MSNGTVLVCDDDELLVELLTYRLASEGYDVQVARNGAKAVAMATAQPPDAIVLDMMIAARRRQSASPNSRDALSIRHRVPSAGRSAARKGAPA